MEHPSFQVTSLGGDEIGALFSIGNGLFPKAGMGVHSVFIPLRIFTRTQQQATSVGTKRLVLGGKLGNVQGSLKNPKDRSMSGGALRIQVSEEETSQTPQQQGDRTPGRCMGRGEDREALGPRGSHLGGRDAPQGFLLA